MDELKGTCDKCSRSATTLVRVLAWNGKTMQQTFRSCIKVDHRSHLARAIVERVAPHDIYILAEEEMNQ